MLNINEEDKKIILDNLPKNLNDLDNLYSNVEKFDELMMSYRGVVREVKTKIDVLNDEMTTKKDRNPIEFVKSRIKKPASILEKLNRRNLPISTESIKENIHDVAGIRVVCSFIDDIYEISNMLSNQDDVEVLEIKDYIKEPKPNGYRSLHMIIKVPVFFSDKKERLKCEIQIRTIAMDFWASLEHKMKYKKKVENTEDILNRLKVCAESTQHVDNEMMYIRKQIENMADK